MATVAPAQSTPNAWLKTWQVQLLAAPLAAVTGLFLILVLQKPDYISLLWIDPAGLRMLVGAFVLLLIGMAAFLGGCVTINRTVARVAWGRNATLLQTAVVIFWVLCCAPAAFVVTIGPAAIQIQRNLNAG